MEIIKKVLTFAIAVLSVFVISTAAYAEDAVIFENGRLETTDAEQSLEGWGKELFTKCYFEADIQFKESGAGIVLRSADNTKSGTTIRAIDRNGKMTLAADGGTGSYYIYYIELDPTKWYHIKLIGSYGVSDGLIDMVVETYDEAMQVTETKNYYVILMNDMFASSGVGPEHITVLENTVVDNVKVTELRPDAIKLSSAADTVVADSSSQLSVRAYRDDEILDYEMPVKYTVTDAEGVTITDDGILNVSADAPEQSFFVTAQADGMSDTISLSVISSEIMSINSAAFSENETVLKEIEIIKNYYYNDTVVFVITVYDENGVLKDSFVKRTPGNALPIREKTAVALEYALPEAFNKETWNIEIYAWGDCEKCSVLSPGKDTAIRTFYEENGGAVVWIENYRVVAGMLNGKTSILQIDNPVVSIDGTEITLSQAPYISADTTYVSDEFIKSVIE